MTTGENRRLWPAALLASVIKPFECPSWYCDQCAVEVKDVHCKHCGKTEDEAA